MSPAGCLHLSTIGDDKSSQYPFMWCPELGALLFSPIWVRQKSCNWLSVWSCKDSYKDSYKDSFKDSYKDSFKDSYKDSYKDFYKGSYKGSYKDS